MYRSTKNSFVGVLCVVALMLSGAQNVAAEEKKEDNVYYVLGVWVSNQLATFGVTENDLTFVVDGVKDGVAGKADHINLGNHTAQLQALQQEHFANLAAAEKDESVQFLTAAGKEAGATTYDSGLVMTTISEGGGATPKATDTVSVHYQGTFRDGTVFDSSIERGSPAQFPLDRVIPCWTEGVAKMKVGGKSKLVCPSDIAYGDTGSPPRIPGGAALVFEVELLEIVAAQN